MTSQTCRPWTKTDVNKFRIHVLSLGIGRLQDVRQAAGLANKRTMQEVQALEHAVKLLVYRAAGIQEAREARESKCYVMSYKASKGNTDSIPPEVMAHGSANVFDRATRYLEIQEKAANNQLSPRARALAVWADAVFMNDEVESQLHPCTRQAVLCDKICTQLETQGPRYCKQLREREALDTLLKAVEAGHAEAQSTLSSLLQLKAFVIHSTGLAHNALPWWSAKDNKALLCAYWERGLNLYNYLDKSHMVFAEQLMLDSNSTVDFSVKMQHTTSQAACRSHALANTGGANKMIEIWSDAKWDGFKKFLIDQLRYLMSGLMDSKKLADELEHQARLRICPWTGRVNMLSTVQSDSSNRHHVEGEHQTGPLEEASETSAETEEEQELSADFTDLDAARNSTAASALPASKRARTDPETSLHSGMLNAPAAAFAFGPLPPAMLTAGANDVGAVLGTSERAGPVAGPNVIANVMPATSASGVPVTPSMQSNPTGTRAAAPVSTLPVLSMVYGARPPATPAASLSAVSDDIARSRPRLVASAITGNQPTGGQAPFVQQTQLLQQKHASMAQQTSKAWRQSAAQQQWAVQQQGHFNRPQQPATAMQQSQHPSPVYVQEMQRSAREQPPQNDHSQGQQSHRGAQQQQQQQQQNQLQQRQTAPVQSRAEQWTRPVYAQPLQPIQRQQFGQPLGQQVVQQEPQSLYTAGVGEPQVTGLSCWDGTHAFHSIMALQQQQLLLREQHLKAELAQVQQQRMQLAIPTQHMPQATVAYHQLAKGQEHMHF